jgi:hypothetical protein
MRSSAVTSAADGCCKGKRKDSGNRYRAGGEPSRGAWITLGFSAVTRAANGSCKEVKRQQMNTEPADPQRMQQEKCACKRCRQGSKWVLQSGATDSRKKDYKPSWWSTKLLSVDSRMDQGEEAHSA